MKYGIVGLTEQETGVLEHHTMHPINLRNALTSDIHLLYKILFLDQTATLQTIANYSVKNMLRKLSKSVEECYQI